MNNEIYTFNELKEKFNWSINRDICQSEQIKYAGSRRIKIQPTGYKNNSNAYKIIDGPENIYTKQEILSHYDLPISSGGKDLVKYLKNRGIIIEQLDYCKRPIYYKIINDDMFYFPWVENNNFPNLEITKEGFIRNKNTKILLGSKSAFGYMQYVDPQTKKLYMVHRIIMETFYPIDNMKDLLVDHIDGNRANNNINNLRWVSHQENMDFKTENWYNIEKLLGKIIKKIGYNETYSKLNDIFEKI